MKARGKGAPINVLLVEDSPGDVRLTQEAFRDANIAIQLHVAPDGVDAMAFLKREGRHAEAPRPDMIPTVILTTSEAEVDILKSYQLQANCYLSKPAQLDAFEAVVRSINDFWLTTVKLPPQSTGRVG
jgi:chemotaxis family two-component system response regulator Rcp1